MPAFDTSFTTLDTVAALAVVALAAFLVTWVVTDLLHVRRAPYIAILAGTVAVLSGGYLVWSGTSVADLLGSNPWWGAVAGLAAAAIVLPLVRRLPGGPRARGGRFAGLLVWEAAVYGTAEGLLLATLPVLIVWQRADASGAAGLARSLGWGALALAAGVFVTLVHHLGYAAFRQPGARRMLIGALVMCGVQGLAFLLTGAVIAPVIAHIALHTQLLIRGIEMPPTEEEERTHGYDGAAAEGSASRPLELATR
jgi:hypothetical protein